MPDDIKFLKYKTKILAVNTGDQPDRLTHDIVVPTFRGYAPGDRIPAGTLLSAIIEKEFNSTPPTPKVTITVVGNGTTSPAAGTHNVAYGGDFTLNSATPATGYRLKDIIVDGEAKTAPFTIRNITADKTIAVTFEGASEYNITGVVEGQGTITPTASGPYEEGVSVPAIAFTASPNEHWKVDSWYVDGAAQAGQTGTSFTLPAIASINKDYEVKVKFVELPKYTITTSAGEHGTITPTFQVYEGEQADITITPDTGYVIDKITRDGTEEEPSSPTGMTVMIPDVREPHSVSATFKLIPADVYHVVIADATPSTLTGAGTISPVVGTHDVAVGTSQAVVATPANGFKIKSFTVDSTEQEISDPTQAFTYTVSGVAKDATVNIIVEFEEVKEVMYDAYVQTSRSGGWHVPTVDNLTLGNPIDVNPADLKANGYTQTVPAATAQRYVIPVLIYPKATGVATSIKEGDITETISAWTPDGTITIDGVEYYMTYSNSVNTTALTSPTTFVFRWQ